jgi:ubiquinone/menaquinone biosynthesis C-methylase UbiE
MNEESKRRWNLNADYWDQVMGQESNTFHRNLVRPRTEHLLDIQPGQLVLDIACGNGNFSERLARLGAKVIAFDYSEKMIEHAKKRRVDYSNQIQFHVADATKKAEMLALKQGALFDAAVSNMAIMDISTIEPLFEAVYQVLKVGGSFVFSTHHPCFERPDRHYLTSVTHEGEAIKRQPVKHFYFHRSLETILSIAFKTGFVLDGFHEVADDHKEFPVIVVIRLKKLNE